MNLVATRAATGIVWSPVLREEIRYRVLTPRADRRGRTCLYLLHGRDGSMDDWLPLLPLLDRLVDTGAIPPLVVVMPDAPWSERAGFYVDSAFTGQPPGRPVETALTRDLVAHVEATYPVAADRTHRLVGGVSMGGAGALRLLLAHPEMFSGGLALSPAAYDPLPPAGSSTQQSGAYGHGDLVFDADVYRALGHRGLLAAWPPDRVARLFVAAGADEDLCLQAAQVHRAARETPGIESTLRVLAGGHDWDLWQQATVEGLTWLFDGRVDR
ncbi:alpha/beta hydrolase [Nocardioides panaciterrulae]|uniref:Enterochelin esterase-like enzyme n=1 Tax=Nocardioides panaciterrulae TaxID=661492 RepID=A0A7Y9E8K3_9ACTN|nr:alpha/beta hydrolase-fold protein [Nocardioides panaciterrulae]NYD43211.1 enterochelin esterase-like enzyme [Nocardioides panaciterrulae]